MRRADAADAVAVPEIIAELPGLLALEWIDEAAPTPQTAERFGRELAALHRAGAPAFGADRPGFIGSLPMDNRPSAGPWAGWFAERRLAPLVRRCQDQGLFRGTEAEQLDRVLQRIDSFGGDEPPARIHGDLWPGNVVWARERAWLVDPAAHGGHRETDLACLQLFGGAPYVDRILAGYRETWPLADGWRERIPLHQLFLLLVHGLLFGAGYRDAILAAASAL